MSVDKLGSCVGSLPWFGSLSLLLCLQLVPGELAGMVFLRRALLLLALPETSMYRGLRDGRHAGTTSASFFPFPPPLVLCKADLLGIVTAPQCRYVPQNMAMLISMRDHTWTLIMFQVRSGQRISRRMTNTRRRMDTAVTLDANHQRSANTSLAERGRGNGGGFTIGRSQR